ncbi:FecCD family ABC transporter permease [Longispora urticae]
MHPTRRAAVITVAALLLAAVVLASLAIGSRPLAPGEVIRALVGHDGSEAATIVRSMRVPRTLIGLAVGAALALAGVVMQALTRNPLADPRLLGISGGASLGVIVAITLFGLGTLPGYVGFALLGATLAGTLVYGVSARARDGASPVTLALAGAAIDASFGAVVVGVLSVDGRTFEEYRFWVVGGLTGRTPVMVLQVLPLLLVGGLIAAGIARGLDALALGEDVARGLGQRTGRIRALGALAVVLLTGSAVAVAGPIGFIGLAVPHLARALVGADHRWVLATALLLGPALLLAADVIGRVVVPPGEVPAGIVTALIGAPLLVLLVRRARTVAA